MTKYPTETTLGKLFGGYHGLAGVLGTAVCPRSRGKPEQKRRSALEAPLPTFQELGVRCLIHDSGVICRLVHTVPNKNPWYSMEHLVTARRTKFAVSLYCQKG